MLGAFPVRQVICPGTGILVIQENIIFIFRAMNVVMDPGSFSTPDTVFPFPVIILVVRVNGNPHAFRLACPVFISIIITILGSLKLP